MFNSVCGEQQPHPARHEAGTEKTRAPNIQRPPGHGTPRRTTAGTTAASTQKRAEEPEGGTSDSHSVGAPGCRGGKPAGSTGSRPPRADRALGPPKAPHPTSGPSKASRARPRQSTAESGPALARASCPGARNHQRTGGILHRQGMVVGWGSTKMMSEAESKARPDT